MQLLQNTIVEVFPRQNIFAHHLTWMEVFIRKTLIIIAALDIKRGRPYSFGLGKRYMMSKNADPVERRSASRYNFGLGKR